MIHCVFFFIHGLTTKQRQMVRRTVTTKLEGMWKEAVTTELQALFRHFPWKTEEKHVNLNYESRTPGVNRRLPKYEAEAPTMEIGADSIKPSNKMCTQIRRRVRITTMTTFIEI